MKLFKLSFSILALAFVLQSCSNDSSDEVIQTSESSSFSSYKTTSFSNSTDNNGLSHTYQSILTSNIINNKLGPEIREVFWDGLSQGVVTLPGITYTNGLVGTYFTEDSNGTKYTYDYNTSNELVGLKWELNLNGNEGVGTLYYRFVSISSSIAYVERLDLPYNDPQAAIWRRSILKFDSNNNVVEAGVDTDLDGQMDSVNKFTYVNDNLTEIHKANGQVLNFQFSTIIDNFLFLKQNSFGKRVLRLLNAERYSMIANDAILSKNLLQQNTNEEVYEVLANGFYKKKTKTSVYTDPVANNTTTTEFFFN